MVKQWRLSWVALSVSLSALLLAALGLIVPEIALGAASTNGQTMSNHASPGNNSQANNVSNPTTQTQVAQVAGNPNAGCDQTPYPSGGNGANTSGPYNDTCTGAPSMNGNGGGQATGRPCAGCVGNADEKNPPGQLPGGNDNNAGYECDRNNGIGKTNPAHTGCTQTTEPPCTVNCEPPCTVNCEPPCTVNCEPPCTVNCNPPCTVNCNPPCTVNCNPPCTVNCNPPCTVNCNPNTPPLTIRPEGGRGGSNPGAPLANLVSQSQPPIALPQVAPAAPAHSVGGVGGATTLPVTGAEFGWIFSSIMAVLSGLWTRRRLQS